MVAHATSKALRDFPSLVIDVLGFPLRVRHDGGDEMKALAAAPFDKGRVLEALDPVAQFKGEPLQ
tara:strand:- start:464 stop:658 length:195 start_codon:yes stop_codon:yes gene_type:complete